MTLSTTAPLPPLRLCKHSAGCNTCQGEPQLCDMLPRVRQLQHEVWHNYVK